MATYDDPSTDDAKLKAGVNETKKYEGWTFQRGYMGSIDALSFGSGTFQNNGHKSYEKGSLGAPERLSESGDMRSSKEARRLAIESGVPEKIRGNTLGCTCTVAHLNAVGPIVDGTIEVDYTCHAGWHNYVVYEVRQYASEGEVGLKIDKFGNLVETNGYQAGELGEY